LREVVGNRHGNSGEGVGRDGEVVLALRYRAATALECGLGFIEAHGDALAQLRAHVLLEVRPADEGAEAAAGCQCADGSFASLGGVFSGQVAAELRAADVPPEIVGTLEALTLLADMGALHAPCVERAVGFLAGVQRSDGSWGSAGAPMLESASDEPVARVAEGRIFATGMLAGYLGRTRVVRPGVLRGAGGFLSKLSTPVRVKQGPWSWLAAFAHFYTNVYDEQADQALQWCGGELERGFRGRRFRSCETVRVLLYCEASALPAFGPEPAELLERLLDEQAPDGGFATCEAGAAPVDRIGPTFDAMLGVIALCKVL